MFILPFPRIGAGCKLSQLLLSNDNPSEVENLLNGWRGAVGYWRDICPCLAASRCLKSLHVVEIFDGDPLASKWPIVAPIIDTRWNATC